VPALRDLLADVERAVVGHRVAPFGVGSDT